MVYRVPYKAQFVCDSGHVFEHACGSMAENAKKTRPVYWQQWIDENIPKGKQITAPERADQC